MRTQTRMTDVVAEDEFTEVDTAGFRELVGDEFFSHIMENAHYLVIFRVARAADHYNRALKLAGIDEPMGVLRLITAEEELVVAIFRLIALKADQYPDPGVILKRYQDHRVKQSFFPTLVQFWFAMEGMFTKGITITDAPHVRWAYKPAISDGKFVLNIHDENDRFLIAADPVRQFLTREDLAPEAVVEAMYKDFCDQTQERHGQPLTQFIQGRADYRNKLLYAYDDVANYVMDETFEELHGIFKKTFKGLLFVLAALVANEPVSPTWGIVSQFFGLYQQVLADLGIGKAPAPNEAVATDDYFVLNLTAVD